MSLKNEFEQLKLQPIKEADGIDSDPEGEETPEYEEIEGFNILILTSSTDSKNRLTKKNPTIIKIENWCKLNDISYYIINT